MKKCVACGKDCSDQAQFCRHCGSAQPEVVATEVVATEVDSSDSAKLAEHKKKSGLLIVAVVVAVSAMGAGMWFLGAQSQKPAISSGISSGENSASSISSSANGSTSDVSVSSESSSSEPAPPVSSSEPEPPPPPPPPTYELVRMLPPTWDLVTGFDSAGVARVQQDNKWGMIDRDGNLLVKPTYGSIGDFSEGLAVVERSGRYGYIDTNGKQVISVSWDAAFAFNDGLARVRKGDMWGFIDTSGKQVIKPQYADAQGFNDGYAPVKVGNKWYFIDKDNVVRSTGYENAKSFSEGMAPVRQNGNWGYVNTSFKMAIDAVYSMVNPFEGGRAVVELDDGQSYIDKNGNSVSVMVEQLWKASDGMSTARRGDLYGYLDAETGAIAVDFGFTACWSFSQGLCPVSTGDKWLYIDKTGRVVLPAKWEEAHKFFDGLARVKRDGKYGFINTEGKEVIDCEWQDAGSYAYGMIAVRDSGKWGFMEIQES